MIYEKYIFKKHIDNWSFNSVVKHVDFLKAKFIPNFHHQKWKKPKHPVLTHPWSTLCSHYRWTRCLNWQSSCWNPTYLDRPKAEEDQIFLLIYYFQRVKYSVIQLKKIDEVKYSVWGLVPLQRVVTGPDVSHVYLQLKKSWSVIPWWL